MKWFCLLLCCVVLVACQPTAQSTQSTASSPSSELVPVSVDAVNYMHDWGVGFTVFDSRNTQPVANGILGFLEGPGGKNCCVNLPKVWQPGMKLKVEWQRSNKELTETEKHVREIEVPRYQQPGDIYVLFYPDHEIELLSSTVEPGHANWAGRVKTDSFTACVARLAEKECNKNLPKYMPGTKESAAAMIRKSCQAESLKVSSNPEGDKELCIAWEKECLAKWSIDKKQCSIDYKED